MTEFDYVRGSDQHTVSDDREVKDAQNVRPTLLTVADEQAANYVLGRWRAQENTWRRRLVQLKVNFRRYMGDMWAQVHPYDPTRLLPTPEGRRLPPHINRIRRAVHRYVAQVTADEPVIEGVPSRSTDTARDAAEAASHVLAGEWERMRLHNALRRVMHKAAILRSGYWLFEWDPYAGGKKPAQMFFDDPDTGERVLRYVDGNGEPVETPEEAAQLWEGQIRCEVLTPANVRWYGGEYAHDAEEVMVGTLISLRQLYDIAPEMRKVPVKELIGQGPTEDEEWVDDLRGKTPHVVLGEREGALDDVTGERLAITSRLLDERVFLLRYWRAKSEQYPDGLYVMVAGKRLVRRGGLPYGCVPVAHFKCLHEMADQLGAALVDLLRDPQELLDFVNTQILRYLQMLRRRWFLPMHSNVKVRDLLNPTQAVITYNPAAGPPIPEQQPEIPNSLVDWATRFDVQFDDQAGIHEVMQGKHVPGVSSGRHAEALRTGDETLLGLTRTEIVEGLLAAGRIILAIAKKEWTTPRLVRYFGADRDYVQASFANTDFEDTHDVRLKRGTLLMMTPAQKLETLYASAQLGILDAQDLRRLAPLSDTAGISLTEEPHYKRARRQNERFLAGPPEELVAAHEVYVQAMQEAQVQQSVLEEAIRSGATQEQVAMLSQQRTRIITEAEQQWQAARARYGWTHEEWENDPRIASIHAIEHPRALASERAESLPDFWVTMFKEHTLQDMMAAGVIGQPMQPGAMQTPDGQQVRARAPSPPTAPAGLSPQGFPSGVANA